MADFDPRQLDRLEDALDVLTGTGIDDDFDEVAELAALELPPALSERLAEYQDVLALCRASFPIEEPRDAVLADVLAEARAVSRRPKAREADRSAWQRFWDRWRGTVVPGFALAATAATVLWVLEPGRELDLRDESRSDDPSHSTPSEPASERRIERPTPLELANQDEPDNQDQADPPEPAKLEPQAATKPIDRPRPSKASGPALAPKPAPDPMTKDETWTNLERANADRRKGECDRAQSRYHEIIAASTDSLAIAQAKAGIGLCYEQDRRDSEAAKWFSDARSAHPGVDAWIKNQRNEQPLPGELKKSKSRKQQQSISDQSL